MNDYIDDFIDYVRVERNYSDYTETNYLIDLEAYESYLKLRKINFKTISYTQINNYIMYLKEEKNFKSTSINRHLSTLRSFYNFLLREGVIESNNFKLINGPKKELKLPNYMKYSEFEAMIDVCDDTALGIRNKCLLEILLATGARISEITNIKLKDININNNEIKVLGKGNKERIVYFGEYAKVSLEDYLNNSRNELLGNKKSDYLFIDHIGDNLTTRGVRVILNTIMKKACVNTKITPHTFRHTFATMLLNEGCDLKSVQELLGHANLSTTSIYTHITNDRIKDVYLHTHPRSKN